MNLDIINNLVYIPSPSGRERKALEYLKKQLNQMNLYSHTDLKGNLIIEFDNDKDITLLFLTHIDEIAFVITNIKDYKASFISLSRLDESELIGQKVLFINGELGIICKNETLYIDISGAKDICVGSFAVFYPFWTIQNDYIFANGLDNKAGCGILFDLMKKFSLYKNINIICAFTVQEEVGARGASLLADYKDTDIIITIDTTPTTNCYLNTSVVMGEGAAIKVCDAGNIIDEHMVEKLIEISEKFNLHTQLEVINKGSTDIKNIEIIRNKSKLSVISIPCDYGHTSCEKMKISDIIDTYTFIDSICKYYDGL